MSELIEDSFLGPAAPSLGWVPAPRYLLRRERILRQLRNMPAGPVLEIGSGAGMLLQELSARGYRCSALETSEQARLLIRAIAGQSGRPIDVHGTPQPDWRGRFSLIMAFEVLEHIADDQAALAQWSEWLAPGGTLLMSVPAHPRQWNAADVWAGHYRRYRKNELVRLVESVELRLEYIECLGFPLANVTERMQARSVARGFREAGHEGEREQNNDRSGIDRSHILAWYPLMRSLPGRIALRIAFLLQGLSRGVPLGNGYLLRATRAR